MHLGLVRDITQTENILLIFMSSLIISHTNVFQRISLRRRRFPTIRCFIFVSFYLDGRYHFQIIENEFLENESFFSASRGALIISHLLYVNDIMIFIGGDKKSIRTISKVVTVYKNWSGQRVNKEKPRLFSR